MAKYKDIIEFVSDDHRVSDLDDDGLASVYDSTLSAEAVTRQGSEKFRN